MILALLPAKALAEPVVEQLSPVDFGELALPANDTESTVIMPFSGSPLDGEGAFILIERGSPGFYELSGFPANIEFQSVEVDDVRLSLGGESALLDETLKFEDYDVNEPVETGPGGSAEFQLGGTLRSSGANVDYEDGLYEATTRLRLTYYDSVADEHVTVRENIEIRVRLSTSVSVEQVEPLDFGTVSARAGDEEQASLTLSPDGEDVTVNDAGEARIKLIGAPSPAILQVSGAAPDHALNITPQAETVYLSHESESELGAVPRFLVEDLTTDPDEEGETDASGQLTIQVGGTLKTEVMDEVQMYREGLYEGTFEVIVDY